MFRTLVNASFKRSLHTASRSSASTRPARLRAAFGASAVATSYLVWDSWFGQRIALDAPASSSKQVPLTPNTSKTPEAVTHSSSTGLEHEPSSHADSHSTDTSAEEAQADGATEGEEAASSNGASGAFNPETGEINWDCPCLGGMAHGPCGMQFREAFSCFVFSEAEPKGINCVEKFKAMQECFREHPDVYGDEIMNDDEDEEGFAPDMTPSPDAATEPLPSKQIDPFASKSSPPPSPIEQNEPRNNPATSSH